MAHLRHRALSRGWATWAAAAKEKQAAIALLARRAATSASAARGTRCGRGGSGAIDRGGRLRALAAAPRPAPWLGVECVGPRDAAASRRLRAAVRRSLDRDVARALNTWRAAAREWRALLDTTARWRLGPRHRALRAWVGARDDAARATAMVTAALGRFASAGRGRAWGSWRAYCVARHAATALLRRAVTRLVHRRLASGWNTWAEAAVRRAAVGRLLRKAAAFFVHNDAARAVGSWRERASADKVTTAVLGRAIGHLQHYGRGRAWNAWVEAAERRAVVVGRLLAVADRITRRGVGLALAQWRRGARLRRWVLRPAARLYDVGLRRCGKAVNSWRARRRARAAAVGRRAPPPPRPLAWLGDVGGGGLRTTGSARAPRAGRRAHFRLADAGRALRRWRQRSAAKARRSMLLRRGLMRLVASQFARAFCAWAAAATRRHADAARVRRWMWHRAARGTADVGGARGGEGALSVHRGAGAPPARRCLARAWKTWHVNVVASPEVAAYWAAREKREQEAAGILRARAGGRAEGVARADAPVRASVRG